MNTEKIDKLFQEYERAFSNLDFRKIAEFYTDSFISAGPKGIIAQNKKELIEKSEQAAKFYKSVGQTSAKLLSKKETPISEHYTMVTTHWGVTFQKTGDRLIEFDITYFVHLIKEPKIIMFITHQDEEEAMKRLELIPQEAGD